MTAELHPIDRLRPRRRITGCAAVLLPFRDDGTVDWDGFRSLLERTVTAGLTPAVNMDTGYVQLIDPPTRACGPDRGGGRRRHRAPWPAPWWTTPRVPPSPPTPTPPRSTPCSRPAAHRSCSRRGASTPSSPRRGWRRTPASPRPATGSSGPSSARSSSPTGASTRSTPTGTCST
ncbi:MAG: hypothetical protein R2690_10180 [Acidimicrobiales bacterium]